MVECPACKELVIELTNVHCTTKHQMTKKELIATHGEPVRRTYIFSHNNESYWSVGMDQR